MQTIDLRRWLPDVALAVALSAAALAEVWVPFSSVMGEGSQAASASVAVAMCLALAFRRRWPLGTAALVLLAWPVLFHFFDLLVMFWGQFVPIVVAIYSAARHGSRRAGIVAGVLGAGLLLFFDLRVAELQDPGEFVFHWLVCIAAWSVGTIVRVREDRVATSRRDTTRAEQRSVEMTRIAVAEERARIARELHDVVAHSVSMMVVQAGAAGQAVDDDPEFAREALETIRTTGTGALAEMRRVVTMLRDGDGGISLTPQPGLRGLGTLVDESRSADLEVDLTIEGEPRMLSAGLDLAAYRIVQEALTNVRRHSGATRAMVRVDYRANAVEVRVADNGRNPPDSANSGGHGLIGMRERATLYGGRFTSGPTATGFVVAAMFPEEMA